MSAQRPGAHRRGAPQGSEIDLAERLGLGELHRVAELGARAKAGKLAPRGRASR